MTTLGQAGALVTGGQGFVGRHLVAALATGTPWVACLDRHEKAFSAGPHLVADLTDPARLQAALTELVRTYGPPVVVFHLAGQASVPRSFTHPAETYLTNVVGTAHLLEILAALAPAARVLIPSTAHVYAPPPDSTAVLDEGAPLGPTNHYGLSKLAQEEVARLFQRTHGSTVLVSRSFNHVGPGQGPGFVLADFARRLALLELQGGGTLTVGNLDAERDYLDVRDVVAAYRIIAERGTPGETYNVASGRGTSARELLAMLLEHMQVPVRVLTDPELFRPVDTPRLVGSVERLRALGWRPRYDLSRTVEETLDYWRAQVRAAGDPHTRPLEDP